MVARTQMNATEHDLEKRLNGDSIKSSEQLKSYIHERCDYYKREGTNLIRFEFAYDNVMENAFVHTISSHGFTPVFAVRMKDEFMPSDRDEKRITLQIMSSLTRMLQTTRPGTWFRTTLFQQEQQTRALESIKALQ